MFRTLKSGNVKPQPSGKLLLSPLQRGCDCRYNFIYIADAATPGALGQIIERENICSESRS